MTLDKTTTILSMYEGFIAVFQKGRETPIPPEMVENLRRIFYSGALASFSLMSQLPDLFEDEHEAVEKMEAIASEFEQFKLSLLLASLRKE